MSVSAHTRYREQLAALDDGRAVLDAVEEVVPGRRWRRTFGRFEPDDDPFATVVMESEGPPQAIVRVEAHRRREPWLEATPFPADPRLPTLPDVLAAGGDVTVVRYRPLKRCTLRVRGNGRTRWAKVLPDGRGEAIHRDAGVLWDAAQEGALAFEVAPPDHYDARTRTVWHGTVPGVPARPLLFEQGGWALAERMGMALGTLAVSGLRLAPDGREHAPRDRAARAGRDLARRVPALGSEVDAVLARIDELHRAAGARAPRPVHGSPHPQQWLLDGERIGLVDFDRLALGDPELEVAVFQAEMDFERGAADRDAVNAAFLDGYETLAGPLDRRRLAAYRAEQRLVKARRSAWALRPDGDVRAARHLARASRGLEQ